VAISEFESSSTGDMIAWRSGAEHGVGVTPILPGKGSTMLYPRSCTDALSR